MYSPSIKEASEACCHGCYPSPFLTSPEPKPTTSGTSSRCDFIASTASSFSPNTHFTNHESLPSLHESFSKFTKAYPQYLQTEQADQIRAKEYYHLSLSDHICLDYIGHGLFSYSQAAPVASSSNSLQLPFLDISYKSVNFSSQLLYGGQESELETKVRKRIMGFMNISEDDYSMVFTANQTSAFKLLAESYPFHSNQNLLTVNDYESEALGKMIDCSKKRGARIMSAEFSWPNLTIQSGKLKKMVVSKRKRRNRGLFVFPLQSRITGSSYSYLWMSLAQENGWHVLLDACALGPKDMDTLGLSLFRPDFLFSSFYKVFGENPSGFGCLFIKKSSALVFKDSTIATSSGIVSLVPAMRPSQFPKETELHASDSESYKDDLALINSLSSSDTTQETDVKKKRPMSSEIEELEKRVEPAPFKNFEIECRGLDHADSLGLILISSRARYLINWLVNALMKLQHPHSENGLPLVRIYGPKIKLNRGPAVAFNVFDWKGEKVQPALVQKLADRNNISLSCGFLHHIWFSDEYDEERESILERRSVELEARMGIKKREKCRSEGTSVVTAALGFLTNFEDIYKLWAFVSRFLDADFVEKERWRYMALNQNTIIV